MLNSLLQRGCWSRQRGAAVFPYQDPYELPGHPELMPALMKLATMEGSQAISFYLFRKVFSIPLTQVIVKSFYNGFLLVVI